MLCSYYWNFFGGGAPLDDDVRSFQDDDNHRHRGGIALVNPHVTLTINGSLNEGDAPADWLMEMTSPGNLVRAGGWRRDAVKAGDKVEVVFSPLRDAEKKGGALKKLTVLATGEVFTANIREQEKPGLE